MAKLRQSELASEFATIIFPKDTHAKLMNDQLDYISKVWKGIGKSVEKNKPIEEFNPGLTKEAKKYLKKDIQIYLPTYTPKKGKDPCEWGELETVKVIDSARYIGVGNIPRL